MGEFTRVVLGFPTVLLGGALVVVVGFWTLVLVGGADAHGPGHHGHEAPAPHDVSHHVSHDASHDGSDASHDGPVRTGGLLAAAGLDGVPVTVVVSLLTALAWFLSLAGSAALDGAHVPAGPLRTVAACAVLLGALLGSWSLTWVLVRPLRRLFPYERPPSREDFVGRLCVIRTGRVTVGFGQAEVAAPDGSTAVVQVRLTEGDAERDGPGCTAGSTALIYAYEPDGEFFRVTPYDPAVT